MEKYDGNESLPGDGTDSTDGISRRNFLGALSAGVAATLLMMPSVSAALVADSAAELPRGRPDGTFEEEERYFAELGKTFTITPRDRYLAVAQKGSMPIPIMKRYKEGLDQIARDPFPVYLEPSAETRRKIARCYGATTDEIAIARTTTDAISLILNGIDWKPGDELLTSTMEYPNCVATMLRVACRFGVTIRQFGVPCTGSLRRRKLWHPLDARSGRARPRSSFFPPSPSRMVRSSRPGGWPIWPRNSGL